MAEKIKVMVEIEPGQEITIKPIGADVAKLSLESLGLDPSKALTGTATVTGGIPGGGDGDGDVDF